MSEQHQLELIRSYASSGFAAVITINSGALIAGLSQAGNLDFVPPVAIACALFIWALGVTTGVATLGGGLSGCGGLHPLRPAGADALEARRGQPLSFLSGDVPARLHRHRAVAPHVRESANPFGFALGRQTLLQPCATRIGASRVQ